MLPAEPITRPSATIRRHAAWTAGAGVVDVVTMRPGCRQHVGREIPHGGDRRVDVDRRQPPIVDDDAARRRRPIGRRRATPRRPAVETGS